MLTVCRLRFKKNFKYFSRDPHRIVSDGLQVEKKDSLKSSLKGKFLKIPGRGIEPGTLKITHFGAFYPQKSALFSRNRQRIQFLGLPPEAASPKMTYTRIFEISDFLQRGGKVQRNSTDTVCCRTFNQYFVYLVRLWISR